MCRGGLSLNWLSAHVYGYFTGLSVYFSNGRSDTHGQTDCPDVHEFHLEPDERINEINVNFGFLIDKLTFHTTKNRRFGPYGGPGGGQGSTHPPPGGKFGHLVGLAGSLVYDQGAYAITRLTFLWMSYMTPSVLKGTKDKDGRLHEVLDSEDSADSCDYYNSSDEDIHVGEDQVMEYYSDSD